MRLLLWLVLLLIAGQAHAFSPFRWGGAIPPTSVATVSLLNATFNGGSSSGVGALSATLSTGTFAGSFSLQGTGTDHIGTTCNATNVAKFAIASVNGSPILQTSGSQAIGSYPGVCVVASQGGVTSLVQAFTITGNDPTNTVTIKNFDSTSGYSYYNVHATFDDQGNLVDAHFGKIYSFPEYPGQFYLIGDSFNCGFGVYTSSPQVCGINEYSSNDLTTWHYVGMLAGTNTTCVGINNGCFAPRILENPISHHYIIWWLAGGTSPSGFLVYDCTKPLPGYCGAPTIPANVGPAYAVSSLFADTDNTGHMAYGTAANPHYATIIKLTSDYKDRDTSVTPVQLPGGLSTGPYTPADGYEGFELYKLASTGHYHLNTGALCSNCSGSRAAEDFVSAGATPESPGWTLNSSSSYMPATTCISQYLSTDILQINGTTQYIAQFDQFEYTGTFVNNGQATQAQANILLYPITYTGDTINTISSCANPTITGLTAAAAPSRPNLDQNNLDGAFVGACGIGNGTVPDGASQEMQTFTPSVSTTTPVLRIGVGYSNFNNSVCEVGAATCPIPNGDLIVELVSLTGSPPVPNAVLDSKTFHTSDMNWGSTDVFIPYNASLVNGTQYAWLEKGTNTVGSFCIQFNQGTTNQYPAGMERNSVDGGSTWNTRSPVASLRFGEYSH